MCRDSLDGVGVVRLFLLVFCYSCSGHGTERRGESFSMYCLFEVCKIFVIMLGAFGIR